MDAVDRQKLLYLFVWTGCVFFVLATLFTSEIKYGYLSVAFAILSHSEHLELRYRKNEIKE